MIRRSIVFFFLLISSEILFATDYYVRSNGNDSNDGTTHSKAWKTIDRVNKHVFKAGDKILFQSKEIFRGNLLFDQFDAGLDGKPVLIGVFGKGRAIIEAGVETGILIISAGNINVENLIVRGSGRHSNKGSGIEFRNELGDSKILENIFIDSVDVSGFGQQGIFIFGAGTENNFNGYNKVKITRCVAHDNLYTGIWVYGNYDWKSGNRYSHKNLYIGYCKTFDNSGDVNYLEKHSGNGILVECTDGAIIEKCVAYNNGFDCHSPNGGPVGIWTHASNNIVIQHNESHHNRTGSGSVDGGGFDFDAGVTNSIFQYNYSHDNDGAGFLLYVYNGAPYTFKNNIVRYNISQNDGRRNTYGAIFIVNDGTGFQDVFVYNNTFFTDSTATGYPSVIQIRGTQNVQLWNNLILSGSRVPLIDVENNKDLTVRNNNYWNYGDSSIFISEKIKFKRMSFWMSATSLELDESRVTSRQFDPQLKNPGNGETINNADKLYMLPAYLLKEDSPLNRSGLFRESSQFNLYEFDFSGFRISKANPLHVGACSFKFNKNAFK